MYIAGLAQSLASQFTVAKPVNQTYDMTRPFLAPVQLVGTHASLYPLTASNHDGLVEAVKDGELWNLWYTSVPKPSSMQAEIERRLALQLSGSMLPFTVFDANQIVVGMTTFMNADPVHRRLEIGSTWYARRAHRTAVNTECKSMLLQHAFEALHCVAVEFRTSALNRRSKQAIERLGAKLDGILRSHQRHSNGTLRDTCVYSVTEAEWPTVKEHLQFELKR